MFQATRPPVKWSSVARVRASRYGRSYVTDAVTPKPIRSVAAAMAGTATAGSSTGHCTPPRTVASMPPPYTS